MPARTTRGRMFLFAVAAGAAVGNVNSAQPLLDFIRAHRLRARSVRPALLAALGAVGLTTVSGQILIPSPVT